MRFLPIPLAALLLAWPALRNGYPLVFSDTGTYLSQAPHHYLGWDRPPFYSAFLFALDWRLTTWPAIAAQGLVSGWMLDATRRGLVPDSSRWSVPAITALLAFASPLPWVVSELMPDLFTGLLVLAMTLTVMAPDRLTKLEHWGLAALSCFSLLAHLGNLGLAAALICLVPLLRRWLLRSWPGWRACGRLAGPLLAAVLALSVVNLAGRGIFSVAPYGGVFLLARVLYDGPGMRLLAQDCPASGWRLCPWRAAMPPTVDDFLWRADSPLNRAGGPKIVSQDAGAIIRSAAFREPGAMLKAMTTNTVRQLALFATGDGLQPWPATVTPWVVRDFPDFERRAYAGARQTRGETLLPGWMVRLHELTALAAIGLCLLLLPWLSRQNPALAGAMMACLAALVLNAAITGALSGPHARYQCRVMWLPLLMLALCLAASPLNPCRLALRLPRRVPALGAVFWCGAEAAASALLSFAGAFVIARMIGAGELGVGAAGAAIHVLLWVGANGVLADAIVQRPHLSEAEARGAMRAGLLLGLMAAGAQVLALWPVRAAIGDARLAPMCLVLALPLPLVGAAGPVQGLLTRARDYRRLAIRASLAQGAGLGAGLALALGGAGAWAVVAQQATASLAGAVILLAQSHLSRVAGEVAAPGLASGAAGEGGAANPQNTVPSAPLTLTPSPRERGGRGDSVARAARAPGAVRELLRIGLPLTLSTLILHARYRLFALMVGGMAGPAVLGQVHMAFRLVETPRELASTALWRLLLPGMAERQGDLVQLRQAVDRALRLIGLSLLPLCALLAAAIRPAVSVLLGPAWTQAGLAAVPLAVLAGWMFLLFPSGVAMVALGAPHHALRAHAAIAVLAAGSVLLLRPTTPIMAVLAWTGAHAALAPYTLATTARVLRCSVLDILSAGLFRPPPWRGPLRSPARS